jgi:hypothetical protein
LPRRSGFRIFVFFSFAKKWGRNEEKNVLALKLKWSRTWMLCIDIKFDFYDAKHRYQRATSYIQTAFIHSVETNKNCWCHICSTHGKTT